MQIGASYFCTVFLYILRFKIIKKKNNKYTHILLRCFLIFEYYYNSHSTSDVKQLGDTLPPPPLFDYN